MVQHIEGRPWLTCCHLWCARGELFSLDTLHFLPPLFAGMHWSVAKWQWHREKQSLNGCCCYLVIRDYYAAAFHDPLYSHPPPHKQQQQQQQQQRARLQLYSGFRGGFYSTEQFKRKWLLFPALPAHLSEGDRAGENEVSGVLIFQRFGWLCSVSFLLLFLWFCSARPGSHWGFRICYTYMHGPVGIHVVKDSRLAMSVVEFAGY